jgi:nicotinamidase-related amidase
MSDQPTTNSALETKRESDPESRERAFLRRIVDPATTALLTMELQNGVVGRDAMLPDLVNEVERVGLLDIVRRVCGAARDAGIRVVHCTHVTRPDGAGAAVNCRIFALSERMRRETGWRMPATSSSQG